MERGLAVVRPEYQRMDSQNVDRQNISKLDSLSNVEDGVITSAANILQCMKENVKLQADTNMLYQQCFQLLNYGGLAAEIPRLVVFGQQSMGKTTLLDYIMGGPIGYSSTSTGTTQPVVIVLKPSSTNKITCKLDGLPTDLEELQVKMKNAMTKNWSISNTEIQLEICLPSAVHSVFVDLPGIKDDSKEGAELTRSVVRNYVKSNPNDLYLLVKKASDDPAIWPWSLREFILSSPPRGLGLNQRQTIVVGTRCKDFLVNEKNDVRTHSQLLQRVLSRAVKDQTGEPFPLYLLELYSLGMDDKESQFKIKKEIMNQQIHEGTKYIEDLLETNFEKTDDMIEQTLRSYFDGENFKKNVNIKFHDLLTKQLELLDRRLRKKKSELRKSNPELEQELREQTPQGIREFMRLFIRELSQIVTELVTGNYMIMTMHDYGDSFLRQYGGSLMDNLQEGHQLASELFPTPDLYDPNFLKRMEKHADEILSKTENLTLQAESKFDDTIIIPSSSTTTPSTADSDHAEAAHVVPTHSEKPDPRKVSKLQPGQYVKFVLSKDGSHMFGFLEAMKESKLRKSASVGFYFVPPSQSDTTSLPYPSDWLIQSKNVETSRISLIIPLRLFLGDANARFAQWRFCRRVLRPDNWIGVERIHIPNTSELLMMDPIIDDDYDVLVGVNLVYNDIIDLEKTVNVPINHVYVDMMKSEKEPKAQELTQMQKIAGEYADQKLLNQLALTYLGRWMKFHIVNLEPDRTFSKDVMLQLMRSVLHVIDKADWEPLVADILQANVRGGILHLSRLAACATAVALRRVLRAAIVELRRKLSSSKLPSGFNFLMANSYFMQELDYALEDFVRNRALLCANTMRDLIFEQTHAIHFEMIEDFFLGCCQFENDFLGSHYMDSITVRVRQGLLERKQRLGAADIYSRSGAPRVVSQDNIYEEVRIQFWVIKMLLSAPLTTKLYMYFIKDIKDQSQHLAAETTTRTCESEMEKFLQDNLLCEPGLYAGSRPMVRSDDSLIEHFQINLSKNELENKLAGLRRVEAFVEIALEGVSLLKTQMSKSKQVDFLMRLDGNIGDDN